MSAPPIERKALVDHMVEELDMSMTEIGSELGVSRQTIANWRRGRPAPLTCPDCAAPMLEPAPRCGFCAIELEEAAAA